MNRVRSRGSLAQLHTQKDWRIWGSCSESSEVLTSTNLLTVRTGHLATMSDINTLGYYKLSKEGKVIFSPMKILIQESVLDAGNGPTRTVVTGANCSGTVRNQSLRSELWIGTEYFGINSSGIIECPPLIPRDEIDDLLIETQTSVLSKRCRSDNDLFESLAEINKTISLLPSILQGVTKVMTKPSSKQKLGALASVYLAGRYGLMPLIKDIEGVMKGLEKIIGKVRKTTRANANVRQVSNARVEAVGSSAGWMMDVVDVHSLSIRSMSLDEFSASLSHNIGFSSKSLSTLPWELVPYSFVVDWFTNLGDLIGSFAPNVGCKQLGSCYTVFEERVRYITMAEHIVKPLWVLNTPADGGYFSSITLKQRIVGPLQRGFVIKNDFRFDNITRSLDAISLILQKIR